MFYDPKDGHGLPHNPFSAIITPRPIGWISTRSTDGVDNLAPYSFFNGIAYTPPQVMFASTDWKDTIANVRATGVFCVNVVEYSARDAMNITTEHFAPDVDEFEKAGLEKVECETIACARVGGAPAALECTVLEVKELKGRDNYLTLGEVTGVHLRDDCVVNGRFDLTRFNPLARLGYRDYTAVRDLFSLARPDD
jgi:flavin reductase (DIM6/NTAB) family NADH-FMN oxidoreductase RutF